MNEKMQIQLEMFSELSKHVGNGIPIFLGGRMSTPNEVVEEVLVKEENIYMADFVRDDNGCLLQVRYDRISIV